MDKVKYYIPLIGLYFTYKDIMKIVGTPHFNLTALAHAIYLASAIIIPLIIMAFSG